MEESGREKEERRKSWRGWLPDSLISGAALVLGEAPGVKTGIHSCQSGTLRATSDTHIL